MKYIDESDQVCRMSKRFQAIKFNLNEALVSHEDSIAPSLVSFSITPLAPKFPTGRVVRLYARKNTIVFCQDGPHCRGKTTSALSYFFSVAYHTTTWFGFTDESLARRVLN